MTKQINFENPALRPGCFQRRRNRQDNAGKRFHENENQHGVYAKGNHILNQTNGEKVFPFHAVHEMKPQRIQRTGNDKFRQSRSERAQGRDPGTIKNHSEQKAKNGVADSKARKKRAVLGSCEIADDIAGKSRRHTHDRAAVGCCCSQSQEGKAKLKKFCHLDAEERERHIGGHEKTAKTKALYLLQVLKLFPERESVL